MQDTSGICVCFGNVQDLVLLENAKLALREMGAKWSDKIQIDTSHFVCTTPAAAPGGASTGGAPGLQYQRALQLSIPIVQPHWILACHAEKRCVFWICNCSFDLVVAFRMVPIAHFYLGASSPLTSSSFNASTRPLSMSQASLPSIPAPNQTNQASSKASPLSASYRASMPAPSRIPDTPPSNASAFINQPINSAARQGRFEQPSVEEELEHAHAGDPDLHTARLENAATLNVNAEKRKSRSGSINRDFKFPSVSSSASGSQATPADVTQSASSDESGSDSVERRDGDLHARKPSAIEVPAPPPVEKEPSMSSNLSLEESVDDDVGPTVEISLN